MAIRELLEGGDRRSVAGVEVAVERILREPFLLDELLACIEEPDELIQMRALDAFEKIARKDATLIAPHKGLLLADHHAADFWETRLQVVRSIGLFEWSGDDFDEAAQVLKERLEDEQPFVKAWALDSLATLAVQDHSLLPLVNQRLMQHLDGTKSMAARARHTLKRLAKAGL